MNRPSDTMTYVAFINKMMEIRGERSARLIKDLIATLKVPTEVVILPYPHPLNQETLLQNLLS